MSIRWRLLTLYSLLLALTLIAFSTLFYTFLEQSLRNQLDESLARRSEEIGRNGITPKADGTCDLGEQSTDVVVSPVYVQVLYANGQKFCTTFGDADLPRTDAALTAGRENQATWDTIPFGRNEEIRVYSRPVSGWLQNQATGQRVSVNLLLQVGESVRPINDQLNRVLKALLVGSASLLLLAGAAGWLILRQALRPIDRITQTAVTIGQTGDFGKRIEAHGPPDEVGRLATTFNAMIERIDHIFQAQKQFVANSSHELRTPLTVIRGNVELLRRGIDGVAREECLAEIGSEAERMSGIVNDLLILAQIENANEKPRQGPVQLDSVLLDVYREAKVLAGGRKLVLGHEDSAVVMGNGDQLKQLLLNLVDNAIKYTAEDGTITLALYRENGSARIEVSDTGIGIAPEDQARIFERFYRVDKGRSRASGGTGLGLAIVKAIADAHGGRITVNSELGRGSTFTVWLRELTPLAPPAPPPVAAMR